MSTKIQVQISGLREFQRSLKSVDSKLGSELRKRMNVSANIIVADAKPDIPKVTGAAASTVKARSTQLSARVIGGGNKAPYYGWLDFGGWGGRNKKAHRPFYSEGRFIYAAYYRRRAGFFDDLERGLRELAERSGLAVD